ncbi:MATE family efflux transporter [Paradevosia shaoguanensis]|uniref:MATE family efflux transporter n=1 Tax=Paradevosia shaoguanensis TaxID=1335043 RepID=A0AA41QR54_9HYPH|nr:MATE family efflux transporter [Paradevosia shaoguanensis]MCF1745012.1 MATE family efflux transporter [Paradevosia shaoguanensis]MCI0129495.1 MATE family efflux transporter [Paradevosia shaoguanensis]
MASNILQSLSGTINNIYVGQLIGVEALAAASTFFPIVFFLMSFIIGLSSGSTVLIGQAWGARNIDKVKEVTGTTLTVTFLAGLVVAVLGGFFAPQLMGILGAPANIVDLATSYGRIFLIGMPAFFLFLVVTSVLRGVGDTVTPFVALIISIIVGLVTTPALILGWFGLPKIGVDAAAVASIAGFISVLVFLFFYLRIRKHALAPDRALLKHLRINGELLMLILKLGVPAGVQMVVSSVAAIVVVGLVNHFGSDATAAYGAVNQVLSYVQFPAMSIGIAASIFGAQAIGAGQSGQLRAITRTGLVMNIIITGALILLAYLFSEHIVRLFLTDSHVVEMTQTLLHIVLWSVLLFGASVVLTGIMRASGTVLVPMIISLATILGVELPGAILFSHYYGLNGIWMGYALSFTTMLVLQAAYYWFFWRRKRVVALI